MYNTDVMFYVADWHQTVVGRLGLTGGIVYVMCIRLVS